MSGSARGTTMALQAQAIRARLGEVEVLHGIDLGFAAGRWSCIVGPNGAGKSTLLKVLAQLLPCEGRVTLLDRPMAELWRG